MTNLTNPPPDDTDRELLLQAVELSESSILDGEGGPFGAVVERNGEIIGRGRNGVTSNNDPTAHAEIEAIRDACQHLETFELSGCTIYSSCEPCPMCLGAIYWARLDRLVYANTRDDAASIGFDDAAIYEQLALPIDEQRLRSAHLPLEEARAVFELWREDDDKVEY